MHHDFQREENWRFDGLAQNERIALLQLPKQS